MTLPDTSPDCVLCVTRLPHCQDEHDRAVASFRDGTARLQQAYTRTWEDFQYAVKSEQRSLAQVLARKLTRLGSQLDLVGYTA